MCSAYCSHSEHSSLWVIVMNPGTPSICHDDSNRRFANTFAAPFVGCIYASYSRYKSNILQNSFKSLKLLSKSSKYSKIFFLNFSVFLLTIVRVSCHFCLTCSTKVCILLPSRGLIPSREALTGSLAQPDKLAVRQLRR